MSDNPPTSPISVRLSEGQWQELFQNIELAEQMIPGRERRGFDRYDYEAQVTLYAEFDEAPPPSPEIPESSDTLESSPAGSDGSAQDATNDGLAEQLAAICDFDTPADESAAEAFAEAPESGPAADPEPVFQRYLVRTRNVSASGLGFIHHTEVAVGTKALFTAFDRLGRPIVLAGTSARADLIVEGVWDIGIHFNQPIDPEQLVDIAGHPLNQAG